MKRLIAAVAIAAAALGTGALPASAANGFPNQGDVMICSMQVHYTALGTTTTSGSGTCTDVNLLQTYPATITPGIHTSGSCRAAVAYLPIALHRGSSVGYFNVAWNSDLLTALDNLPLQAGTLTGGVGIGIGAGPSTCSPQGVGTTDSSAVFALLAPNVQIV